MHLQLVESHSAEVVDLEPQQLNSQDSNSIDLFPIDLNEVNQSLSAASAEDCLSWVRETCGDDVVLTSSFGAESALMLHLASQFFPKLRVIFIDTGYLFPETYRFAEQLRERFDIELLVYTPAMSSARQEALYGERWSGDADAQRAYLQSNKVEPLDRALRELAPKAWLAGLRSHQTEFRKQLRTVEPHVIQVSASDKRLTKTHELYKVHPILNWSEAQITEYMQRHQLPYHPLHAKGYKSIGDEHSTFPVLDGEDARAGRNLGVHRECGIHLPREQSHRSSAL